jgi:hypothetical protein
VILIVFIQHLFLLKGNYPLVGYLPALKMNLFFLHPDPKECAKHHCDKHVVKMILELVQMLYTCHNILGTHPLPVNGYKSFGIKHPTCLWIRDCESNYRYTVKLVRYLCEEYTHRYFKIHKCESHLEFFENHIPVFKGSVYTPDTVMSTNKKLSEQGMSPVPLAMYSDVKLPDTIDSYRKYYTVYKKRFAKWTNREVPYWYSQVDIFRLPE